MIDFVTYDLELYRQESSCFKLSMMLKDARQMERIKSSSSTGKANSGPFEQPAMNDVLCGKDKTYGNHPGNQRFREMIESFAEMYKCNHSKQHKMKITRTIVTAMKQKYNTRFIKKIKTNGNDMWEQISDAIARDKVSHALRFAATMKHGRKSVCTKKMVDREDNDDAIKLLQTQKRSRGSLLEAFELEYNSGHYIQPEVPHSNATVFQQQHLRRDSLLGSMGLSQDFDAQYISNESILRLQRSSSNATCDVHMFDIEPTPLNDPGRQPFLQHQTSVGNMESFLSSLKSEDFQNLLHDDIEKDWV